MPALDRIVQPGVEIVTLPLNEMSVPEVTPVSSPFSANMQG